MKQYLKRIVFDSETYRLAIVFTIIISILLCLDYQDSIANYIVNHDITLGIIIAISILVIAILFFLGNNFFDLLIKIPIVNSLDRVSFLSCIVAALYYVVIHVFDQAYTYKCTTLIVVFVVFLFIVLFRLVRYFIMIKKSELKENTIYDFRRVVEEVPEANNQFPILISERDVDYDLFGRREIIFQLQLALEMSCKSDMPFVIGLSGEWGSGKTTILNIVKKSFADNKEIEIIDNFDPWVYSSPEAMLVGMYYTILQKTGVHYSNLQVKELIDTVCEIVEDSAKVKNIGKIARSILSQEEGNDSIGELKNIIDDYLRTKNKTIVFFIDNLDRATAENVRFVFKLVGAVFDFERVKYVLSYDKKRLSEIFKDSLKIDSRYVEKIINQELVVPKISDDTRSEVYRNCLNKLLLANGVLQEQLSIYENIIQFIIEEVQDIRMFKRLLNSAFFLTFGNSYLYKPDLLMLEIIRFLDLELYESIYENRRFFIDSDTQFDRETLWWSFRTREFNEECKLYYDELFQGREHYKLLLSNAFSYVSNYQKGYEIKQEDFTDKDRYKNTQLNSRINSAKFFDLYFSHSLNAFLNISVYFDKGLKYVLSLPVENIEANFSDLVLSIPEEEQLEWTQKLYFVKDDIDNLASYPILVSLYNNIEHFDNERGFLTPSARERVFSVMANLFLRTDKQNEFISLISNDISKLFVITSMIYWLADNNEIAKNKLVSSAKSMCDNILQNSIDLYQDTLYVPGNIWSIFHTLKHCGVDEREEIVRQYIAQIINPQNIYRVLRDTVSCSIGQKYIYSISKENFESLFGESTDIQRLLNEHAPRNSSEQLIYDLYQEYHQNGENYDRGRCYNAPFIFEL